MITAINGATTMPYPLDEDIRAAAAAGFDAVEIWRDKMLAYLNGRSVADLRERVRSSGLAVVAICAVTVRYGEQAAAARDEIVRAAEVAAALDCPILLTLLSRPAPGTPQADAVALAASELGRAADAAADFGVKLAVEPLGRHPLVPGPREALEIVGRAGRPNVGIIMDTFHYYLSDVPLADIVAISPEKLLLVHVNGGEDLPRQQLTDRHRLYPTLGIIPAADMVRAAMHSGYDGALSVEIFRDEYYQRPVDEISRQSKMYLDRLIAQV